MSQEHDDDCLLESLPQEATNMPHLVLVVGPQDDDDDDGEDEDLQS